MKYTEQKKYTEDEIRLAWEKTWAGKGWTFPGSAIYLLVAELRKGDHVHDFTDADMITVKEIRDAWGRRYPSSSSRVNDFLRDISERREPVYIPGKIYQVANGGYYLRTTDGAWTRVILGARVSHEILPHPLRELP